MTYVLFSDTTLYEQMLIYHKETIIKIHFTHVVHWHSHMLKIASDCEV